MAITFTLLIATVGLAQKKELKAAEKAIKNSNFAEAKSLLGSLESVIGSADDKLKGKYHFLLGKALYANGSGAEEDMGKAIENLNKSGSGYANEVATMKSAMVNTFLTSANSALEQKNYAVSSNGFEKAYRLSPQDTLYLFYAASIAVNGQEYDSALKYYNELQDMNYSGVETEFVALNKETGEEESFPNEAIRDISVKGGTHIKPSVKKSEPRSGEIAKNIALIYVSQGKNEEAINAMKKAREANPEDLNLLLTEANVYYKMGDTNKYKELIQIASEKDPNNAELSYNLGVLSADAGDIETAKGYYTKAMEIDPTYVNAFMNMAALVLDEESKIVDEMNQLGSSAADDRKYDELKAKRMQVYKDAIPYLESALEIKQNNLQAATTLMNIYSAIGDTAKYKEMKAMVDSMNSDGGN
ncbi:MAG: tetratricopeptide repeat protein [Flavobacteriaceae bacterium]|nr:MAG: tetratricopeptide repeat protein [Flavobacteriaceae bacterium]